jgi:hypothetical protein
MLVLTARRTGYYGPKMRGIVDVQLERLRSGGR